MLNITNLLLFFFLTFANIIGKLRNLTETKSKICRYFTVIMYTNKKDNEVNVLLIKKQKI